MIITIANQKGGVSKTTTAFILGTGLAARGSRVIFIDLDPQCNLSYLLQAKPGKGISELLQGQPVQSCIQETGSGYLLVQGSRELSAITGLAADTLRAALQPIRSIPDYIIIDTPPNLSAITINAFTAADTIIIPTTPSALAIQGINELSKTISGIKAAYNPRLSISGILFTKHNTRTIINKQLQSAAETIAAAAGTKVYQSSIRQSVTIEEALAQRQSIFTYAPNAAATRDYESFITEFIGDQSHE